MIKEKDKREGQKRPDAFFKTKDAIKSSHSLPVISLTNWCNKTGSSDSKQRKKLFFSLDIFCVNQRNFFN